MEERIARGLAMSERGEMGEQSQGLEEMGKGS